MTDKLRCISTDKHTLDRDRYLVAAYQAPQQPAATSKAATPKPTTKGGHPSG